MCPEDLLFDAVQAEAVDAIRVCVFDLQVDINRFDCDDRPC